MSDDDFIPLSALQHYLYCPRQCALIHVEQRWEENQRTAEGRLMHDRADQPKIEKRRGVRTVTAMPLAEPVLGIAGVADVVEFHYQECSKERPYPVEYKRGRPKAHQADAVQLCAQAMCLEHMLNTAVPEGALYYGDTRHREVIPFDSPLRELTRVVIADTRHMLNQAMTPPANYTHRLCNGCSLLDICQPKAMSSSRSARVWLQRQLQTDTPCDDN